MIKLTNDDDEGKKRKGRKLVDISVDEITLCKSPATGKLFFITKAAQPVVAAVEGFLEDAEEGVENITDDQFIAALEELKQYRSIMPESTQLAIDRAVRYVGESGLLEVEAAEEEKKEEEEEDVKKVDQNPADDYPSFKLPGEEAIELVEQAEEEPEELEEEEEEPDDDQMNYDPTLIKLNRIEKKLDRLEEPQPDPDPWPSVYVPGYPVAVVKAKVKKEDPNKKAMPVKKSIDDKGDDEELKKNVIIDDVEDDYPSLDDAWFEPR